MSVPVINVAAVVMRDPQGRLLLVRKSGTSLFMLPGGKPVGDESFESTVIRELEEELSLLVDRTKLHFTGIFSAAAANEPGYRVVATVFEHPFVGNPLPRAEIAEFRWQEIEADIVESELAPLILEKILPALSRKVNCVTVFAGASIGASSHYKEAAAAFGRELSLRGITVVYGGGNVGLMKALADGVSSVDGHIIGVMPEFLVAREIARPGLSRLDVVPTMYDRKSRMGFLADAFVALPGGAGTIDEFFDAWTAQQLGVHQKPIALYDSEFWAPLISTVKHLAAEGFVRGSDLDGLIVADDVSSLLSSLEQWSPPNVKWT